MRRLPTILVIAPALALACAGSPDKRTLAHLRRVEPDLMEVQVRDGLDQAMKGYEKFLAEAPESALTPEAMRRLADLKLEKEYGYLDPASAAPAAPPPPTTKRIAATPFHAPAAPAAVAESESDFERRAAAEQGIVASAETSEPELPGGETVAWAGPLEAIELYDRILETYPSYEYNDWVLYQKARAFDELGRTDEAIAVIEQLVTAYPYSRYTDEVQFRRAEYFFTRRRFLDAEEAYAVVTGMGPASEYYELALYKLGWSLYKQQMYEEALHQYVALLDYKVSIGYDFDQQQDEGDERRIADTYRVISLTFSDLGGPKAVAAYFEENGQRSYESRIYSQLGEYYLEKRRYADAAAAYETFVGFYPFHRVAPSFGTRVIEIYEAGGFPKLVLDSKKEFAARYGLQSEYWQHFDAAEAPEVLSDLKSNLEDLANHYHALYQEEEGVEDKPENFREALRWYRAYLASFPEDPETPGVHYQVADLLLEHEDFGQAALEYEHTAYQYPLHEQAGAAGYAAIFAHRENEKATPAEARTLVTRSAVGSTLRFVDTFPEHEHAAAVLGAAVDDLYDLEDLEDAITTAQRLIDAYPSSDLAVRRSAWAVLAHASFDLGRYVPAEQAYSRVLEMTPAEDESRQAVVDSLAAAIYKQGEEASLAEDHRLAADHFLRIAEVAPTSAIRPSAEYDAGAALIKLEDWAGAASVLDAFRQSHPGHELHREATKQMAFVYREQGSFGRAAEEYERVAAEAETPLLRSEALLLAGELHEQAGAIERALAAYLLYVDEFSDPIEVAVETRFKIAGLYEKTLDETNRHAQLRRIVKIDREAGEARTPRIRVLAAKSALVLSEGLYDRFVEIQLVQPFEKNLAAKQKRMEKALKSFDGLVDYEAAEVTAAATFYMAEIYFEFSRALLESERPRDLNEREMQEYELVLEEEAFPFEEKAIVVHEKNLELLAVGVFNPWIEKSLGKLAGMMPGRYAKFEASSGLIASIDRYAYRAPNAHEPVPDENEPAPVDESPDAPPVPADLAPEAESASAPTALRPLAAR